jgi:hypothetical protein
MGIAGFVDYPHLTVTKLLKNAIVRNGLADHHQPDWELWKATMGSDYVELEERSS